ncbi:NAD(+) diphosphatase [Clostridium algoriphilum]|uniref:NAD(+) diphosphatase n=1 Tax=Clostridium algoriphilum TaxID=198347 RepID=UPI001CF0F1B5|nr:NAD(+) diphosphatase [Clostridium algoriphilum]MCB2292237.1 NAD(+) diphosphatase [Clostridium algoriphilum]
MSNEENITDFIPGVHSPSPESKNNIYFLFYKNNLLVKDENDKAVIPTILDQEALGPINIQYFGSINNINCFYGEIKESYKIPNNMKLSTLKALTHKLSEDMFWIGGRAVQLVNFNKDHMYCGRCGSLTKNVDGEISKKCPNCGLTNYPRICPAIIVAVVKENKILLAHNNQFSKELYSVVSGFVEVGETFEECVRREVYEETGLKVKNIKYFGNQPWPFPNSIMIGYTAEYESGEIHVDGVEIGHADWFCSAELPLIPDSISIARKLINWFTKNH